jgi:hypothetical protein
MLTNAKITITFFCTLKIIIIVTLIIIIAAHTTTTTTTTTTTHNIRNRFSARSTPK